MSVSLFLRCALMLLMTTSVVAAFAAEEASPDYARETRLANQIADMILDGDPVWLQANQREFLGIYTEADAVGTAVLIVHGRGFHPDWADAINPLRVGLVEQGYSTLSLQMPVLEKDAKYYDYVPIFGYAHERIEAGIRYLRQSGHSKVILLAHSCGVHMSMDWIRQQGDASIDGYIGLGMGATDYGQPMLQPFPMQQMGVAVLDLYGELEFPAVIRSAAHRKAMLEAAGHGHSRQQILPQANHYFTDQGDALVTAVANWLDQLE